MNEIGDTGLTALSNALKANQTLTELNLQGEETSRIHDAKYIIHITKWLTENKISYTGITELSDVLRSNATLTKLNLSGKQSKPKQSIECSLL